MCGSQIMEGRNVTYLEFILWEVLYKNGVSRRLLTCQHCAAWVRGERSKRDLGGCYIGSHVVGVSDLAWWLMGEFTKNLLFVNWVI